MSAVFADSGSNQAWICGLVCNTTLGARTVELVRMEFSRNTESHHSYRATALRSRLLMSNYLSVRRVLHIVFASDL